MSSKTIPSTLTNYKKAAQDGSWKHSSLPAKAPKISEVYTTVASALNGPVGLAIYSSESSHTVNAKSICLTGVHGASYGKAAFCSRENQTVAPAPALGTSRQPPVADVSVRHSLSHKQQPPTSLALSSGTIISAASDESDGEEEVAVLLEDSSVHPAPMSSPDRQTASVRPACPVVAS